MELFHTSVNPIDVITTNGTFGEFLFSPNIYSPAACDFITYSIEIDDEQIIDAPIIFYHKYSAILDDIVSEFCLHFRVDTDEAEEIIAGHAQRNDLAIAV